MRRCIYLFVVSALAVVCRADDYGTFWASDEFGGAYPYRMDYYIVSWDGDNVTMNVVTTQANGAGGRTASSVRYDATRISNTVVSVVNGPPRVQVDLRVYTITGPSPREVTTVNPRGSAGGGVIDIALPTPPPSPSPDPKFTIEQTENITNSSYSAGELLILDSDGNVIGRREVPARFTGKLEVVVPEGGSLKYRAPGEGLTLKKVVDGEGERWEVDPSGLPTISSTTIGEAKDGKLIYEKYEVFVDPKTGLVTIQGRKAESAVQIDEDKIEAKPAERTDKPAQDDADVDQLALLELQGISDNTLAISENTASIDQALRDADGQSFLGKLFNFFGGGATEAADKDWDSYASGFVDQAQGIIGDSFSDLEGVNRGSFTVPSSSSLSDWKISIPRFGVLDFDPTTALPSWFWVVLAWVREVILWAILLWFLRDMLDFLQFVSTGVASSRAETTATAIENAVPGVAQIKGLAFGTVIIGLLLGCYTAMLVILDSNLATLVSGTSFSGGATVISSIVTADFSVPANIAWAWNFIDQLLPLVTIIGVLVAEVLCRISVFVTSVTFLLIVRFVGALK